MGGTGLEPVTPSLSIWGDRSRQFACAQTAWLSEIHPETERSSEPERTLVLAILPTRGLTLDGVEPGSSDVSRLAQAMMASLVVRNQSLSADRRCRTAFRPSPSPRGLPHKAQGHRPHMRAQRDTRPDDPDKNDVISESPDWMRLSEARAPSDAKRWRFGADGIRAAAWRSPPSGV
jgi:hypothetical protein